MSSVLESENNLNSTGDDVARQESLILGHRPREQNNSETINSCSCCTAANFDTTAHSPPPTAHRPSPALRTNDKPRKMKKQCAHKLSSRRCPKLHSNGLEAKTKRSGQKESQLTGKAVEKRGGGCVFKEENGWCSGIKENNGASNYS